MIKMLSPRCLIFSAKWPKLPDGRCLLPSTNGDPGWGKVPSEESPVFQDTLIWGSGGSDLGVSLERLHNLFVHQFFNL